MSHASAISQPPPSAKPLIAAILVGGVLAQSRQHGFNCRRVALRAQRADAVDLLLLERGIDAQDLDRLLVVELVAVDADDDPLVALDLLLVAEAGLGDLGLEE